MACCLQGSRGAAATAATAAQANSRCNCHCDPPLLHPSCLHHPAFLGAVLDSTTGAVLPNDDPVAPDPMNRVNVMVIDAPNARSVGALGLAWLGWAGRCREEVHWQRQGQFKKVCASRFRLWGWQGWMVGLR